MTEPEQDHRSVSKTCTRCKVEQGINNFYRNDKTADGKQSHCKSCNRTSAAKWRERNPGKWREVDLRHKYKMSQADYDKMLASQNGVCAICGGINDNGRMLAVDHNHDCCPGKRSCGNCVRQLLCGNCNNGLGRFKDNAALLKNAIEYLERHKNV